MDNKQLDQWLAEEVMGWHLREQQRYDITQKRYYMVSGYYGEGNAFVIDKKDWHPTTDIAQAMMCARAITKEPGMYIEIDINISPDGIDVSVSKYKDGVDDGTPPEFYCLKSGNVGEEVVTICHAIYESRKDV